MFDPAPLPVERLRALYDREDPYPEWARRRARGEPSVLESDGDDAPPRFGVYAWKHVRECLRHDDVGLSDLYRDRLRPVTGEGMHCLDPPAHTEVRSAIEPLFREAVDGLDDRRLRELLESVVETFPGRGRVDLVADFTTAFPFLVLGELLGLSDDDLGWLRAVTFRFGLDYMFGGPDPRADSPSTEPREALLSFFRDRIRERRENPGGEDLLARLIHLRRGGRSLGEEEILAFLMHLAPAATATTAMATGMLFYALLTHSDQQRLIREDPSRVDDAVEEGLRWSPPFAVVEREARRPLVLDGTSIPRGARLRLYLGAANRDPERYRDPHVFDLERSSTAHLSFAAGPHVCLGESLARREMRAALRVFYDRVQDVRIDPEREEKAYIGGRDWRGIPELPVVLETTS